MFEEEGEEKVCHGTSTSSSGGVPKHTETCLLNLPTHNKSNFASYDRNKTVCKRPIQYISVVKETDPEPQVIVADKRNLLMKFYSKRWNYSKGTPGNSKKREVSDLTEEGGGGGGAGEDTPGPSNKHLRTS
eukprot:sb/3475025/